MQNLIKHLFEIFRVLEAVSKCKTMGGTAIMSDLLHTCARVVLVQY